MNIQLAAEEYAQALRQGQKEYKERLAMALPCHPLVLDELLESTAVVQDVGVTEIPAERIVGVQSAGRVTAFSPSFLPLLKENTEFAGKWIRLCADHLGDTGIREPIQCLEYLGNFYVQEGNKRVSVLRYFGSTRIPGTVKRILPAKSEDPRIRAYYEFLDFYKVSRSYVLQFLKPGGYAKLLQAMGKRPETAWTEEERRSFHACCQYFSEAYQAISEKTRHNTTMEEALLLWLELYPFEDLGRLSGSELKKTLSDLWTDVVSASNEKESIKVETKAEDQGKPKLLERILSQPDHLNVAFVHQVEPGKSSWVMSHEEGRSHVQAVFGEAVTTRSYFGASTPEEMDRLIGQAVEDGAQVVFTTSPAFVRSTLKAAVSYPKVRFLNCSVNQHYPSIRTYYGRIYEAKFITGAIAGALAADDRIGYITSYPILGVPASINAFALGAQMTNPRAQIQLRWSCLEGTPQADLFADGIRVISNRSAPVQAKMYMDFCSYGTYLMDDRGELIPLGTPVWVWGKFYEFVLRSVFSGGWKQEKGDVTALNYWLGMDSGAIGLNLSERLPAGVRYLAEQLKKGLTEGTIDPFARRITAQDGTVKNDGSRSFTPEELLHMDWLCDNVVGSIPAFRDLLPSAQPLVRELGIYRDIPEKEEGSHENPDRIR